MRPKRKISGEAMRYPGITIVSDGFSTHGGEGGNGLLTALGLIKYYKIPRLQVWIPDQKAFDELAHGTLTEEMFDTVQEGQTPYDWKFYRLPHVQKVRRGMHFFLVVTRVDDENPLFNVQLP